MEPHSVASPAAGPWTPPASSCPEIPAPHYTAQNQGAGLSPQTCFRRSGWSVGKNLESSLHSGEPPRKYPRGLPWVGGGPQWPDPNGQESRTHWSISHFQPSPKAFHRKPTSPHVCLHPQSHLLALKERDSSPSSLSK